MKGARLVKEDAASVAAPAACAILAGMDRITWEAVLAGTVFLATRKEKEDISGRPHRLSDTQHLPSLRHGPHIIGHGANTGHRRNALAALVNKVIALLAHQANVSRVIMDCRSGTKFRLNDMVPRHLRDGSAVRAWARVVAGGQNGLSRLTTRLVCGRACHSTPAIRSNTAPSAICDQTKAVRVRAMFIWTAPRLRTVPV